MTGQEILHCVGSDLPNVPCEKGCHDCCSGALWSPLEWHTLPLEHKKDIGIIKVEMRTPGNVRRISYLPVLASKIMAYVGKKKLAVVEMTEEGLFMTAVGLEKAVCPFVNEEGSCGVYEYRPFICRIMGCSTEIDRLTCPKGHPPDKSLPPFHIEKRFAMWTSVLPRKNNSPKEVN